MNKTHDFPFSEIYIDLKKNSDTLYINRMKFPSIFNSKHKNSIK